MNWIRAVIAWLRRPVTPLITLLGIAAFAVIAAIALSTGRLVTGGACIAAIVYFTTVDLAVPYLTRKAGPK